MLFWIGRRLVMLGTEPATRADRPAKGKGIGDSAAYACSLPASRWLIS